MNFFYLGFLISLLSTGIHAQVVDFGWAKSMGGTFIDIGTSIITDSFGNVYTTGYYSNTVDFDPNAGIFNLIPNGAYDVFIQKLDASGNFLWAKSIGGVSDDEGNSITIDALGNAYITGSYGSTVDFDPGAGTVNLTSNGGTDIFVLKLDANGDFLWVKSIGGMSDDGGSSITSDASGNIYILGSFEGTVDFNPGFTASNLTSNGLNDNFILKLDANGNFLWAKSIGGSSTDAINDIDIDASGNVYVTGWYEGTVDFDPNAGIFNMTVNNIRDPFILKLDASGNFLWAKSVGGTGFDHGIGLTIDPFGNVCITGSFSGTGDFDPGVGTFDLTSIGSFDIFVLKLDANGDFLWAKSMGGQAYDVGASITTDAAGSVYLIGNFSDIADFDSGTDTFNLTSIGSFDIFILKLDIDGGFMWAKSIGGTFIDFGNAITINSCGIIHIVGSYSNTVDFDISADTFNLTSNNASDIFILQLGQLDTVSVPVDSSYCPGDVVPASMFTSNFADGTFIWTNSNPGIGLGASDTGNTPVFIATNTTASSITAIITVNVCMEPLSNYTITVNSTPIIDAGADVTIELGENTTLNATGTNGNYIWSPPDGLSCTTCASSISTPEKTITYTLTLVDSNDCIASDSVTVTVELEKLIFVPNAFSPNGDGFNDVLYVRGQDIESFQFVIYDRWGNKVFESTSLTTGWDGLFRGKKMNKAVFVYHLKGIFKDGSEFNQKGNISLIR